MSSSIPTSAGKFVRVCGTHAWVCGMKMCSTIRQAKLANVICAVSTSQQKGDETVSHTKRDHRVLFQLLEKAQSFDFGIKGTGTSMDAFLVCDATPPFRSDKKDVLRSNVHKLTEII